MLNYLAPYLNFNGEASEALDFYAAALGGEIDELMRWKDMPGDVPPAMAERIMHSRLNVGDWYVHISDVPPDMTATRGSADNLLLDFQDPADLDRVFAALAEGGQIQMPVEDTFWGARFGKLVDRFGVSWMMNCQLPQND